MIAVEQLDKRHQPRRHRRSAQGACSVGHEKHHADAERSAHEEVGNPARPRPWGVSRKFAYESPQHQR